MKTKDTLKPQPAQEMTMNTVASNLSRHLICAAAAAVITLVLAMSFVQSTSTPRGAHHATITFVAVDSLDA